MDNQDKIFEKIKNAAQKGEEKDFAAFEKVWSRVEEKLDKKEDKKAIVLWKKLAIAASLLLFFSLGFQFLKIDSKTILPTEYQETKIVLQNNKTTKDSIVPSENIKTEATKILQKQIEKKNPVAVVDHPVVSSKDSNVVISKSKSEEADKQLDAIISQESNNTFAVTPMASVAAKSMAPTANFKEKAESILTADNNNKTITGILTDENDNLPIPGATVTVKGTKNATVTDFDGKFSIEAKKGEQLIFNTIGYNTAYATVEKSNEINKKLNSASASLNEVVVVGYGKAKKNQAKNADPIAKYGTTKFYKTEKEKSVPHIKDALYVINGEAFDEVSLFGPNPKSPYAPLDKQKIESVQVLSKEEIYKYSNVIGQRTYNGVIIITTENGIPLKR